MSIRKGLLTILFILVGIVVMARIAHAPVAEVFKPQYEGIPILMYHKVAAPAGPGLSVTPSAFEDQIAYLKSRGFSSISLDQLVEHWDNGNPLPPRPIVITFDDGYEDNYLNAFPVLKKHRFTATVFLVYNQIGGYNAWDDGTNLAHNVKLLSWPQIREMQKAGISFQSHTLTHPNLQKIDAERARKEIFLSKSKMEKTLGAPVNFFCYPYGSNNNMIANLVREAGYKAAISVIPGKNDSLTHRYRLKRLRVNGYTRMDLFSTMIEQ